MRFAYDLVCPDATAQFQATLHKIFFRSNEILHKPTVAWEDCVVSWNTCLNRAFNVNWHPPPLPVHGLFWNRSGESLLSRFRKTDPARLGPGGGMGSLRWWTPEVDAAGLPLPRTPHPDNGPTCSHGDRGRSETGGKNTARINSYAYFSSLVIVGAANQLVMFSRKSVPVPNSKMDRKPFTLLPMLLYYSGVGPICVPFILGHHIGVETDKKKNSLDNTD